MGDAPRLVRVRFAVVSWAPPGTTVAVVGKSASLGAWSAENGHEMACSLGSQRFESEPDYWWVDVEVPAVELASGSVEFKFVQRTPGAGCWTWDQGENRTVCLNDCYGKDLVLLPVEQFKDGSGAEANHTGRFYSTVKERKEMSVRKVSDEIFLGSCPRLTKHIGELKDRGITAVMNFQAECDCKNNFVEGIGMELDALAVAALYEHAGIEYVWLPTEDMSTAARTAMLPHASYVMSGLLRRGHKVYVHCNAGVGRSTAAVCGYLLFCVGLSLRQMHHVVARARTVAYFDFKALQGAEPRYRAQFGAPDPALAGQKLRLLEAAGLPVE